MLWMMMRDTLLLADDSDDEEDDQLPLLMAKMTTDIETLRLIRTTRYLGPRERVAKAGNLHLAWIYAEGNENDEARFRNMLRLSPFAFSVLLHLIKDHPIFSNNSNSPQRPVELQLAVVLYRLGRYGNGASLEDVARTAAVSEGSVENFTRRVFTAIESLHELFVRPLTPDEKEVEKQWVEREMGFEPGAGGSWRHAWIMYDGTIVPLFAKPGLNGQGYYTRKSNYGLNVQIGNIPSSLRIVDYSLGHTGSAHDQLAFEGTAAYKYPEWLFEGEEFGLFDSAYTLTRWSICIIKEPAAQQPDNMAFNKKVSHLRVWSEHCMGALKGRWQCLRGLRVNIESNADHVEALRWITVCIILHNLVIDVEGESAVDVFREVS
uniref:DDE Tnp4 domain-containing protein n=1 Tax=Mycena chlorophos TaxID=658473 RepID=A0ABQ0L6S2_MYCCL|nr:predicted protein [Mycena chlorophos]